VCNACNWLASCVSSAYCCWETWCELAMVKIGEVYMEKSSGPRTEPWGTPTKHGLGGDEWEQTEWLISQFVATWFVALNVLILCYYLTILYLAINSAFSCRKVQWTSLLFSLKHSMQQIVSCLWRWLTARLLVMTLNTINRFSDFFLHKLSYANQNISENKKMKSYIGKCYICPFNDKKVTKAKHNTFEMMFNNN